MINVNEETINAIAGWATIAAFCVGSFVVGHTIGKYTSTIDESEIEAAKAVGYLECMNDFVKTVEEEVSKKKD